MVNTDLFWNGLIVIVATVIVMGIASIVADRIVEKCIQIWEYLNPNSTFFKDLEKRH